MNPTKFAVGQHIARLSKIKTKSFFTGKIIELINDHLISVQWDASSRSDPEICNIAVNPERFHIMKN